MPTQLLGNGIPAGALALSVQQQGSGMGAILAALENTPVK